MIACSDQSANGSHKIQFAVSQEGGLLGRSASKALIVDKDIYERFKTVEGNFLDVVLLNELAKEGPGYPDGMTYIITTTDEAKISREFRVAEDSLTSTQLDFLDELMSNLQK